MPLLPLVSGAGVGVDEGDDAGVCGLGAGLLGVGVGLVLGVGDGLMLWVPATVGVAGLGVAVEVATGVASCCGRLGRCGRVRWSTYRLLGATGATGATVEVGDAEGLAAALEESVARGVPTTGVGAGDSGAPTRVPAA